MKLTPPEVKVKLKLYELRFFSRYLLTCANTGFEGINNYYRWQPVREDLFVFHMKGVIDKVRDLLYKKSFEADNVKVILKLSYGERVTLSNMFKRVEVPPILMELQYQVINQLTVPTYENFKNNLKMLPV